MDARVTDVMDQLNEGEKLLLNIMFAILHADTNSQRQTNRRGAWPGTDIHSHRHKQTGKGRGQEQTFIVTDTDKQTGKGRGQ